MAKYGKKKQSYFIGKGKVAKVIVNLSLDKGFDYLIPDSLKSRVRTGAQVRVPFGHSERSGYVLAIGDYSAYTGVQLKSILGLCDDAPQVNESLLKLADWMATYYCCSKEQAVRTLLPGAVRSGKQKKKKVGSYFLGVTPEDAQKYIFKNEKRSPAKCAIVKVLLQRHGIAKDHLLKAAGVGEGPLRALVKSGEVDRQEVEVARDPFANTTLLRTTPADPTPEQKESLKVLSSMLARETKQHTMLLHGVTGSGKTEVYLQAIAEALERGEEAIVLVPEISLTPQTTERFRARFGEMVSVLHSRLSDGERFDEWMKIHEEKVRIVVGARSALFAPFRKLGLIVVDEEHENSYKQDEAPRYNARDVAVVRGALENAIVVLGTATPSLESYHNAVSGKYILSELTKRVDDYLMPKMRVVDMRDEAIETGQPSIYSRELVDEIHDRLRRGEQTIIFLNRRGFASQMMCRQCGYVAGCSECSISYTYHRGRECLTCHLCGAILPAPKRCPDCQSDEIRYGGLGTEKVEAIACKLFPSANIARMDSDTMTRKDSYEKTLGAFRSGKIDILIGTQMIAKGLHFPNVTLVGVIYADLSLRIPDFRAQERTFQLLTQVAGRAGRGEVEGLVVIQTYSPFNPAIQYAVNHDYKGFYDEEMELREVLAYPPAGHMIAVKLKGKNEEAVAELAAEFLERVMPSVHSEITVSGPNPSPIAKIKGNHRYAILFRGTGMKELRATLRNEALHGKRPNDVWVSVDADPLNLM